MSTRSAKVNFLLDLAFRVPPLLEKIDSAFATHRDQSDIVMIENIFTLKKTFETWLKSFCSVSRLSQKTSPRVVKNSIHDLTCESLCRICLLLLVEGLTDLESREQPERLPTFNTEEYATELRNTVALFLKATKIPIVKARGVSGPLHFLGRHYSRTGNAEGEQWCLELKESLCKEAPYLSWDLMLPWSLLTLYAIPLRTTEVALGSARRALI